MLAKRSELAPLKPSGQLGEALARVIHSPAWRHAAVSAPRSYAWPLCTRGGGQAGRQAGKQQDFSGAARGGGRGKDRLWQVWLQDLCWWGGGKLVIEMVEATLILLSALQQQQWVGVTRLPCR